MKLKQIAVMVLVALVIVMLPIQGQQIAQNYSPLSRVAGAFVASNYNTWSAKTVSGNAATGASQSIIVGPATALQDGRPVNVFGTGVLSPITVNDANAETVTPTAVSVGTCPVGVVPGFSAAVCTTITGTFNNLHGASATVTSGSAGLQEALNDANLNGGGQVVVDKSWAGTQAMLSAAIPFNTVSVADSRSGVTQYWVPQAGATTLAAPATLTAVTALPSTTPTGTFTATAYNMCIAYVDVMGQEGPCSTSFVNTGAGATSSFVFSAPAASTGAVGYTIYIGLTGAGSTTLQYKVPLITQPATVGVYPASNGVCTLTTVELTTPACAVANTTYGQSGATATVSAITLNTMPIQPVSTTTSTTSVYVPNPGGRTTYTYAPGLHLGAPGLPASMLPFTIGAAAATVVPNVIGSVNIPPGFMNVLGRTLRVCGEATTTASTATIVDIQFQWDSLAQNTAGKGVLIGDLTATPAAALATTGHASFCQDFQTTVTSASATGGSINHVNGFGAVGGVSLIAPGALADSVTPGAIGSLNLAADARINVIYLHTTGTDGAGWTLQNLSAQVVN